MFVNKIRVERVIHVERVSVDSVCSAHKTIRQIREIRTEPSVNLRAFPCSLKRVIRVERVIRVVPCVPYRKTIREIRQIRTEK